MVMRASKGSNVFDEGAIFRFIVTLQPERGFRRFAFRKNAGKCNTPFERRAARKNLAEMLELGRGGQVESSKRKLARRAYTLVDCND